jgi:hypothetical protein
MSDQNPTPDVEDPIFAPDPSVTDQDIEDARNDNTPDDDDEASFTNDGLVADDEPIADDNPLNPNNPDRDNPTEVQDPEGGEQ